MARKALCYNPPMLASILIAALGASPPGQIAYVAGANPEHRQARVLVAATGESIPVGPGHRDGAPRWSPYGLWLALETAAPGGQSIYVVRGDGTEGRLISHGSPWNESPAWSADGTRLAYSSGTGFERSIVVYDLKSGTETRWGGVPGDADPLRATGLLRPVWLPDGALQRLVEPLGMDEATSAKLLGDPGETKVPAVLAMGIMGPPGKFTMDIHAVTIHGALPFPLSILPSEGHYEEWGVTPSPRGAGIAFESNDGGDREIFVLGPRGVYDLSNHPAADWNPAWSNDGSWIAFESLRGGRRGVYRVHNETDRVVPVAASPSNENWAPSWSPGDEWIAFVSDKAGQPDLYAVSVTDGQTVELTADSQTAELAPAWRPLGASE